VKLLSFFSGVGGLDLGFQRAGFRVVGHAEIDPAASGVLAHQWAGVPNFGDINAIIPELLPHADVWGGGFPCQDLSVAGNRAGLAGARSGLWYAWHRLLRKRRPRWVVVENVPGLLSSNDGRDFAIVLAGLAGRLPGIPAGGWQNTGFVRGVPGWYSVAWRVLDAQYFGVAQQRRRVFIVASLGDGRCAEVLFERQGGGWHPAPRREAGAGAAGTLTAGAHPGSYNGQDAYTGHLIPFDPTQNVAAITQSNRGHVTGDKAETIRAGSHGALPMVFGGNDTRGERSGDAALTAHGSGRYDFETETFAVVAATVQTGGNNGGFRTEPGEHLVGNSSAVRRLTPRECERLQGFPDDWTAHGVRGAQADSARYRQMGNAIAVTVTEWIARRIKEARS
jgi:DNA (cytosine-5)-methyltransferase 1